MNGAISAQVLGIAQWIEQQIHENPYSDVGVVATVHDGRITRVAQTLTRKVLPGEGEAHGATGGR